MTMGRLLIFLLIAGAIGLAMTNRVSLHSLDLRSTGTRIEGRSVILSTAQLEAHFSQVGRVEESYMLFGGDSHQRRNQLSHAVLAGLAIPYARSIAARYPDFHLCKSRGAPESQRLVESMNIVALDRSTRATLIEALALFEDRLQSGGERTCLHLHGSQLILDSVYVSENGEDISNRVLPTFAAVRFVLADQASIEDCTALLR